jgi:hypothetical protein
VSSRAIYCNRPVKQELQTEYDVSGVDWRFYKHPLPEYVYNVYMQYRKDVDLFFRGTMLVHPVWEAKIPHIPLLVHLNVCLSPFFLK